MARRRARAEKLHTPRLLLPAARDACACAARRLGCGCCLESAWADKLSVGLSRREGSVGAIFLGVAGGLGRLGVWRALRLVPGRRAGRVRAEGRAGGAGASAACAVRAPCAR